MTTPEAVIAGLGVLTVVLLVAVGRLASRSRALATRLAATTANLQKYAPMDEIDVEIARRRMSLQTETARAHQRMDEVRHEVEAAVTRMRQDAESEHNGLAARVQLAREELGRVEAELARCELELELEEAGFYQPKFDFGDAAQLADALDLVREAQKELVRQRLALEDVGDPVPARMRSVGRLALQAFNAEAATIVAAVAWDTFEASKEKLHRQFTQVNRLLEPAGLRVASKHLELKVKEMALAYDFRRAQEEARRGQAALRETMRTEEDARQAAERLRARSAPAKTVVFRPEARGGNGSGAEGETYGGERGATAGDTAYDHPRR